MRPVTWLLRLGMVVIAGALLVSAIVVAVAPRLWQVANAHDETPVTLPAFKPLAQRSYAYDVFGNEISLFELENSQPIPLDQIPQDVRQAFLAVEDREFYTHDGVNVRSLVRATLSNFASDSPQQGASTITMQVVKNDFLSGLERDGRYKLLQVHYALMLERQYTKDQILERYLNTVFFGNNAYGIQAAAETYFGTTADQLNFIQAAFLAGLVRAPSTYDPVTSPERSRARFTQVLERLVDDKYITAAQSADLAANFVLPDRVRTTPERSYTRTYYTEALRDYLLNRSTILGATYAERYNNLFRGGLRIHTSFNPINQSQAEQARNVLPDTKQGFDAALVSLDTKTGAIRAMVGGKGFVAGEREVNMALQPRQTGSSIKFFVLAAALQAGAQPDDIIDGANVCSFQVPDQPDFVIKNAVMRAPDTLAAMTWYSINCAYVRLAQIVGLNRMVDTVYRMAQSPYLYPGQPEGDRPGNAKSLEPFVSFSTGANEMAPIDMAAGAQTIANNGLHHEPYYVDWIDTADGRRIYTHVDAGTQVLDPGGRRHRRRHAEGRAARRHRPPLPAGRWAPGRRQDRHPGRQHERLVRRLHAPADDRGVDRRPERLHEDGRRARVQPEPRAGRSLPDADLEDVHGRRPRRPADGGLGAAAGRRPPAGPPLPAGQRVPRPRRDVGRRGPRHRAARRAARRPPARPGFANPAQAPPGPDRTQPCRADAAGRRGAARPAPSRRPGSHITTPRVTRLVPMESGTTVPPNVLDPRAPMPSTPLSSLITRC